MSRFFCVEKCKIASSGFGRIFEGEGELMSSSSNLRKSLERDKIKDKDF